MQYYYWTIVRSYIKLKDLDNTEKYYFKSKEVYNSVGGGAKKSTDKFLFTAKLFYEFAVTKKKEFKKYIPEMEWFIQQKAIEKSEPKEVGLINFYLANCFFENNEKEKAIKAYQEAINYLQNVDWGFYSDKADIAEEQIKKLGGKPIINKVVKKSNKSFFKRTKQAILFPFMAIMLIAGLIYAIATGKVTGEKKKKQK